MSRIIVAGSLNQDLFCYVDHLPRRGETLASLDVHRQLGGKGFNQAVALRRLGADVEMVGAVGSDEAGRAFEAQLDSLGIGRELLRRVEAPTGLAMITVDAEGDNTIVLAPGANVALSPDLVEGLPEADGIMVQGELPPATTIRALEQGRGVRVVNPAPASLELSPAIAHADVVVANEGEAADMGGVDRMQGMGAAAVVVTLGSRGALLDNTLVPAPRVEVVDSTGAGDAFCAALTLALVEGRELEAAMAFANRAGAAACLRQGTSEAMPTRAEVDAVGA